MTWVLFIMVLAASAPTTTTAEFHGKAACEQAARIWTAALKAKEPYSRVVTSCAPKGPVDQPRASKQALR